MNKGGIFLAPLSVAIVFATAAMSLLWWYSDVLMCACVYCVDGYCEFADKLFQVLSAWNRASIRDLQSFSQTYLHAHNPLAPLLIAIFSFVTPHRIVAYMVVSALATLLAWVYLRKSVEATWSFTPTVRFVLLAAFFSHRLVVHAFVAPITDALGMMCTIVALYALKRYLETRTAKTSLFLMGAQFIGLFSRVSFIPMLGMPVIGELVGGGSYRERIRKAFVSGLLYGLVPGLLYLGINTFLGTMAFGQAWANAHLPEFTKDYDLINFLASTLITLQGYGVLIVAFISRDLWKNATFRMHLAWIGLYSAFLAFGGGALWPRYFLPLVPSLFVLASPILESLYQTRPWNVRMLIAIFTIGNFLYPLTHSDWRTAIRLAIDEVQGAVRPQKPSAPAASARGKTTVNDFDGDGKTDMVVYEQATGNWFVALSGGGQFSRRSFGGRGFLPVPGQYRGDGRTEVAVYEKATGKWFVGNASYGFRVHPSLEGLGWIPVPADYDGDGKTDTAAYEQATGHWYINHSAEWFRIHGNLGGPGFLPVPGDYDGDGNAEEAVYEKATGNWFIAGISSGFHSHSNFGGPGFVPVPGDYDGDGKTDMAVYEIATGNWVIVGSSSGSMTHSNFGGPGFVPVPGDYDGDGKTDAAVYDATKGNWFIDQSTDGFKVHANFGGVGYVPVLPQITILRAMGVL